MPRIIGKDSDIVRRMFLQASQAVGCTAIYHELVNVEEDLYNDPTTKYFPPVTLEVLFDENPKVKMLREFGWYNEDDEIRPLLVYLPIYKNHQKDLLNVQEHTLIELVYMGVSKTAWFRITAKRLDSLFGNYWICKCAPERRIEFIKDPTDGYFYLSVNRTINTMDSSSTSSEITQNTVTLNESLYLSEEETLNIISVDSLNTEDFFTSDDTLSNLTSTLNTDDTSSLIEDNGLDLNSDDSVNSEDDSSNIGLTHIDVSILDDVSDSIGQESDDFVSSEDSNTSIGQESTEVFYMDELGLDLDKE
jgi:hypothetical protein